MLASTRRFVLMAVLSILAGAGQTFAGTRIERSLDLAPGGRFALDTAAGSVAVTGTQRAGVRIVITSTKDLEDEFAFRFDERPGSVSVEARRRSNGWSWLGWARTVSLHYEVELPASTRVRVDTRGGSIRVTGVSADTQVETSGGAIELAHLRGRVEATTSGGSIEARDVKGPLRVETSGGRLDLVDVAGDLAARTSGGSIRIERAGGRVEASTSGGSVEASFAPGNSRGGELETSAGSIRVQVDPDARLTIDAASSAGSVRSAVPLQGTRGRSALRGSMGGGGATLRVRTSAGSISIEPLAI